MAIFIIRDLLIYTGDGNPDDTRRLVEGLNQDDLPAQFRRGACENLDFTGVPPPAAPKPNPDGAVNAKPLSMFIGAFVAIVMLTLFIV